MSLAEAADRCQALANAARAVRSDVLVLSHGGPIATPQDAQYVLDHSSGIDGFYGASSVERLPTEIGIREQTQAFMALHLSRR